MENNKKETHGRREFFKIVNRKAIVFSCIMLFFFVVLLTSCKKKPDGEITVTTKSVTDITTNSARCGGNVFYTGGFTIGDCGVCYSTSSYPTVSDACTNDYNGAGSYNSTINNLESGTEYYVRAYARTSSGIKYGNQESFTTKENGTWLYYGDGVWKSRWGLTNGGTLTWAVMFPSSMLATYSNTKINKIKICAGEKGTYTVNIYEGGTSSPTTLLFSKNYSITSTGITKLEVSPSVDLNTNKNLWIAVTNTQEAGEHPAGNSEGVNNANARWRCYNGDWTNETTNGWEDVCWFIHAFLSNDTGKDFVLTEMLPPQPVNSVFPHITKLESIEDMGVNPPRCANPN